MALTLCKCAVLLTKLFLSSDIPSKTATGTIAIQVTDSNDHCPTLITKHNSLCSNEKTVFVTGCDEDVSPNSAPFTFRIITDGTQGNWVVEVINGKNNSNRRKNGYSSKSQIVFPASGNLSLCKLLKK